MKGKNDHSKRTKRLSFLLVKIILITLLLNLMISTLPTTTEAIGLYNVEIEILDTEIKECEVGLSKPGAVNYSCRIYVDKNWVRQQSVVVNLYPEAKGWGASIAPKQMVVLPGQDYYYFKLFVIAPPRESSSTIKQVNITGNWQMLLGSDSGLVEPNSVITTVKPFYQFTIIPVNDYVKAWPTETVEFELIIMNQGNAEEDFAVTISDYEHLAEAGYTVILDQSAITIPEREQGSLKFKVSGPQKFYPWKSQQTPFSINIVGKNSQSANAKDPSVKVAERDWSCIYYEVGVYVPEQCIFGIILVIVILISLIWARRKNKLFWKIKDIE